MKIYTVCNSENTILCHPIDHKMFEEINLFINGNRKTITDIEMEIINKDGKKKLLESDFPWIGSHALIFNFKSYNIFMHLFENSGTFEKINITYKSDLFIFKPFILNNAIIESECDLQRFSTGRIMWIKKYSFNEDIIKNKIAFGIPELRVSQLFLTEEFYDLYQENCLFGLDFKKEWEC